MKKVKASEAQLHKSVAEFLDWVLLPPALWTTFPAGWGKLGKATAGQMEREGVLITHYPLLIQKTLADKLSDKVQVIIAPTPAAGHFIGSSIIGDDHPEPRP